MLLLVRLIAADEWDEMNADAREASVPIMRMRKNTERMWGGSNHAGRYVYKHFGPRPPPSKKCEISERVSHQSVVRRSTVRRKDQLLLTDSIDSMIHSFDTYM